MLGFHRNDKISALPLSIYEDLAAELNSNNNWKTLAEYLCEKLEYLSSWVKDLEDRRIGSKNKTPAENLLVELDIKMCTIEGLCILLENCNLLRVLSILCNPEILKITVHPSSSSNEFKSNSDNNVSNTTYTVALGKHLHLSCKADGLPPPSYQWYHEDKRLDGQTSNDLNILVTSVSQKGSYYCQVLQINHKGEKIYEELSNPAVVDIAPTQVTIEKQPPLYLEIREDECLLIQCEASGYPAPNFQWYKNGEKIHHQISNSLQIENFTAKDEGKYYCEIFNNNSKVTTQKTTVLLELPHQQAVAKIALLIANENYDNQGILKSPKNDVAKVAKILSRLGFHTICLADLTLIQMKNAIEIFCDSLIEGAYGLFYFAGHGFKMQENYMLSIDAPSNYLRKDAICESELLSMGLKNDPALFVVILDMCQTAPPVECNPKIHEEVPSINEYTGRKNLRNLLQAYSTSSYRPSYERSGKDHGLYATHLCKYLKENMPVTKLFEQVGKSIDTWFKGAERKQIPMFATTVTKPYRLEDSIISGDEPASLANLYKLICFPDKDIDINFQQTKIKCRARVSPCMKPYLNFMQVSILNLEEKWTINFYNSVHTKRNNLFQSTCKNKCWIHNPQINKGPLVVSLLENGVHVGATLIEINQFIPPLLNRLDN